MDDLTQMEMRVLDAVDFFGTSPDTIRADLRTTYTDLVGRGYIMTETRYVLTDKAREIVEERDAQKARAQELKASYEPGEKNGNRT